MASKIDGIGVAAVVGGTAFVYAGITGRSILQSIQAIITGKAPATAANADPIKGQAAAASSGGGTSVVPVNAQGLANPIGRGAVAGRIDEGVDFSGDFDVFAMGSGVITNTSGHGWPGGTYILEHLDNGMWVYYAENITPSVSSGQRVTAGQKIGHAHNAYPFTEFGFGTSVPGEAAARGHYTEGVPTPEGQQMRALLTQLGAP